MKLAGMPATNPALVRARAFILKRRRAREGAASSRAASSPTSASTRGMASRRCPPSSCSCRSWFPINIYEMSSWARGTVVPLVVLMAKQPYVPIAAEQACRRALGAAARIPPTTPSRPTRNTAHAGATSSSRSIAC